MPDRRALFAAMLVLVLAGGCGVSQTGRPADLGDAAVAVPFSGGVVKEPAGPDGAVRPVDLVNLYLQAAVGTDEQAVERVRRFFAPDSSWRPSQVLTVVRLIGPLSSTAQGRDLHIVSARVQEIGTMTATGGFDPGGADPSPTTLKFTVVGQGTPTKWRLEKAEDGLMISDTTLESNYQPSPVYFWNSERTHLVPDLRYVPLTMGVSERLNRVVEWQLDGPSPWLAPAVYSRPNVKLKERVAVSGGAVVVNLSSGAASDDPNELQRLTDQLRWTLRAYDTRPLELRIEGRIQNVDGGGGGYLAKNAAAVSREPALFSLDKDPGGKVVSKNGLKLPPVLNGKHNANVSYAAVSPDPYDVAAYVGVNGRKFTIARTGTSEQDTGKVTVIEVKGLDGTIGRPVWIPGKESEQFLVPAGGRLWVVGSRTPPTEVDLRGITGVTSVSVSPDGRRVALAARGRALVCPLVVDRGRVQIPSQRELVPGRMSVSAVAWVSETKVLVAGEDAAGKAALFRATADGAVAADESPDEAPLIDVIAFPDRTGGPSGAGDIVARTEGAVFYVFSRSVQATPDLIRPFYAG